MRHPDTLGRPASAAWSPVAVAPMPPAAYTPLATATVAAGFPDPAESARDEPLDFNALLVGANKAATFAVRVVGDSMIGAGIFPGDIAVVDRSLEPANGAVVIAVLDGAFTMKRFIRRGDQILLRAENKAYADIVVGEGRDLEIWGSVTRSIRMSL